VKTTDNPKSMLTEQTFSKAISDALCHNREPLVIIYEPKLDRITAYLHIGGDEWESYTEIEIYNILHGDQNDD